MNLVAIILISPLLINFILLFQRKKKWVKSISKWLLLGIFFIIGFAFFIKPDFLNYNISRLISWSIMTPFIFSILDFLIKQLSYTIQNRDLYLWLRGSSEIDDTTFKSGSHVRASDRILSMFLLVAVIFLPFVGMLILK